MPGKRVSMEYETENLYLAAGLLGESKKLIRAYRNGNGKVIFLFDNSGGDIQRLAEMFWSSELRQPVNLFANYWRDLRKLIDTV